MGALPTSYFFLSSRVALIEHNFSTQSSFLSALGSSFYLTLLVSLNGSFLGVGGHTKLTKESLPSAPGRRAWHTTYMLP
jgi:hypothetical protein